MFWTTEKLPPLFTQVDLNVAGKGKFGTAAAGVAVIRLTPGGGGHHCSPNDQFQLPA
jgi:hypothetical protein